MTTPYLALAIAVRAEPFQAAQLVKAALSEAGAVIVSAHRHGNQALIFGFEITVAEALSLKQRLQAIGSLLDPSEQRLSALNPVPPHQQAVGSLHVTLIHDAPDERIELPKVPG